MHGGSPDGGRVGAATGRLILMCGLPCAGKTAVARTLEADGAVRMSPDEWMGHLRFDLHDDGARDRVELLQWDVARRIAEHGIDVVLENGFWSRSERDAVRTRARELGVGIELRFLDVPPEELWARVELRNAQVNAPGSGVAARIERQQLELWSGWFEAPDAAELALFDSARSESLEAGA